MKQRSFLGLRYKPQSLLAFWKRVGSPRLCPGWRPVGSNEWEGGQWAGASPVASAISWQGGLCSSQPCSWHAALSLLPECLPAKSTQVSPGFWKIPTELVGKDVLISAKAGGMFCRALLTHSWAPQFVQNHSKVTLVKIWGDANPVWKSHCPALGCATIWAGF